MRTDTQNRNNMRRAPNDAAKKPQPPASKRVDTVMVVLILILLTFGIIMVFSASYPTALHNRNDSFYYIRRHVVFVLGGLVAMFLLSRVDYHKFRRFAIPLFLVALFLLGIVLIPGIGSTMGTFARRWIAIGAFNFQPSEVMKFALIVLFAHLSALNYKRMGTFVYGVVPYMICLLLTAGLMMLEPHLSGTILIFAIGFVMMFVGGTKLRWFVGIAGIGVAGVTMIAILKGASYISERAQNWLNPFAKESIRDGTWQTVQSLVAIGSGGILGRGIGNSRQKYLYIPEPYNDFIFSIICEELGLIGALLVIILFLMFTFRGFAIASKAPDKFGYLLGVGLTSQICLQAVLNIAVVTNTIPNTGISLPFFSYGGTALLMQLGEMGILLNISRQSMIEKT